MATTGKEILPEEGKRNILITSALPYVNNVPHLGNIIGSVLSADVFSRYCKSRGYPTLFICGTDEYGTATETKAIEDGVTPQELCDKYHKIHADVYQWFQIGFDKFGRTPTTQQTEIAQEMFLKLLKNEYLEERTTTQPYCEKHDAFLADRYVEGECPNCAYPDARGDQCDKCGRLLDPFDLKNPRCKLDGASPIKKDTKHVYILLDKLQPQIEEWARKTFKDGGWSTNGINITETWFKEGLRPRGITRDLRWGTPVPLDGYGKKVLYVWFDATIGYVSITANYTSQWKKWWHDPSVQLYQFMGKDNVPFHSVIFPGSQLGTGDVWTMPHHISTTEYLQYEKGKFSKSRNIGVFGNNAKDTGIPPDVWRYYLLSHRPESGDSEFEWEAFIDSNNNDLLKNLGNLVNRIIKFVASKVYDSVVPAWELDPSFSLIQPHIDATNALLQEYVAQLEAVKLKAGLTTAMHVSALGNKLLQDHLLNNALAESQPALCAAVVNVALNHVHLLAALIEPYMPGTAASINTQLNLPPLGIPTHWSPAIFQIKAGHKLGSPGYLFTQIKTEKAKEWREQYGGDEQKKAREEAEAKKRVKKAEKERKKAQKKGKSVGKGDGKGESVEAAEKGGHEHATDAVEEVREGVGQVTLQTS